MTVAELATERSRSQVEAPLRVNYFSGSGLNSIFNQTSTNSSFSTL